MQPEEPQNHWQENQPSEVPETPEVTGVQEAPEGYEEGTHILPEDTQDNPPVTWTAEEYIHLDRSPVWFILFAVIVLGLIAVDVFLLKSWTFSALVIVMAVALIIYIRRPPRTLTYALSPRQGLYVGERLYRFDEFKAFGLVKEDTHHSILLIPRKRFAPGVSVFFPDEAGERIVDILGTQLPMENLKLDVVDTLVRKLRL